MARVRGQFDPVLLAAADRVLRRALTRGWKIATAESCTGGLIAALLTDIAGSSAVVERGFVTYSNEAKAEMLGVPPSLIAAHGAVSEPVARAMAEGALRRSHADLTISVTGIAGPGGATETKPVGLVHFGLARSGGAIHADHRVFPGNRTTIRLTALAHALALLTEAMEEGRGETLF